MDTQRKKNKGGLPFRNEPVNPKLIMEDLSFMEAFTKVGCMQFFQRLQGHHIQVSQDFAPNFKGTYTKVGILHFPVSPNRISQATRIPRTGEECFKAMNFNLKICDDLLKPENVGINMIIGIPRTFLKGNYSKLLMVIHKYFTCEGRFHTKYLYHFKLLLHFIGKQLMDIPFYIFRSLGKISDKVQGRPERSETSIFHHGLIKFIVLEELKKLNRDWGTFLFMSGYEIDAPTPRKTPKSKTITPRK